MLTAVLVLAVVLAFIVVSEKLVGEKNVEGVILGLGVLVVADAVVFGFFGLSILSVIIGVGEVLVSHAPQAFDLFLEAIHLGVNAVLVYGKYAAAVSMEKLFIGVVYVAVFAVHHKTDLLFYVGGGIALSVVLYAVKEIAIGFKEGFSESFEKAVSGEDAREKETNKVEKFLDQNKKIALALGLLFWFLIGVCIKMMMLGAISVGQFLAHLAG
jgi:hypothetical protein